MSYKYTVLNDNPLAFFLLDEVRSGEAGSYNSLKSIYATYQDLKDNGISYAAVSGLPIIDHSGNAMEGYAINSSEIEVLPIIGAGVRGTEVNEHSDINLKASGIATSKKPDSPFSIEAWFSPSIDDLNEYLIVGDIDNQIGLFYSNENVIFKCGPDYYVHYKYPKIQAMHIVGSYSKNTLSLFINGQLVAEKDIYGAIKFSNEELKIKIGPANTGKRFIVDSIAIYDYEVTESMCLRHYKTGYKETKYSQIVYPDNGTLFSINSLTVKPSASFRYPGNKPLSEMVAGDAYYNISFNRIEFEKTISEESKSYVYEDRVYIPSPETVVSSRISYGQDVNNITVEVSIPGYPWVTCNNNAPIPYFNKNQNMNSSILDFRVTMQTEDSSFDLPYFNKLEIDMYSNKDFYSDNSGAKIYSDYDYSMGYYNYPVRMQNKYNGLSMIDGHGFSVDLAISPKTIELFFTPRGTSNILFSSDSSHLSWSENGLISKNGIYKIYVNGIDRTNELNINTFFLPNISHHVILVLSEAANNIKFNQNQSGSEYGTSSTYNNIAFYENDFTEEAASNHYRLYCSDNSFTIIDQGITVSESSSGTDGTPNFIRSFG